mgnify:CR=1 FL=1
MKRPDIVTDKHLEYLDTLRKSGSTNMFGAGKYLQAAFPGLRFAEVDEILQYWMTSFGEDNR